MVLRMACFSLLLSGLAFAQPASEVCKERCTKTMMACLNPCANNSSKNADASLGCVQACRQKNQPCFDTCK